MTELERIRALVGEISEEQIRYVDSYVGEGVALFLPAVGPCLYAVTPDHTHPAYSFVLAFDDRCRIAVPGRGVLASEPGRVMAMDPDAPHHEIVDDEHSRYVAVFIERGFFESERARYRLDPAPYAFAFFAPGPELSGLLKEFMTECENRLPGRERLLEAIGLRIVHSLIRAAHGIGPATERPGQRLAVGRVIEYLHAHFGREMTVGALADHAGLSPSHFSRLFRRETGSSPMAFLHRLRLEKARQLLRADNRSITAVALDCGFANPSHFAESFRKAFGQPPRAYRESLR